LAWAEHLRGETEAALAHFAEVESLYKETDNVEYPYSLPGIWYADTLIRSHATPLNRSSAAPLDYARRITEANLEILTELRAPHQISMCHRVLGDLDAIEGQPTEARAHYDEALRIARSISVRDVLIEALLGRGRYVAKDLRGCANEFARNLGDLNLGGLDQAFSDLREALELATRGGYRIYEADIRVALAWAHRATPIPGPSPASGGRERARAEAARARAMSERMGYPWGQVDAEEVLEGLDT
jgi:tetratricopeptide (TPR) repeat protein